MSVEDRLKDADVLWVADHRVGALFSVLVAVTALSKDEFPDLNDGDAFRRFLNDRHAWSLEVEHRGQLVSFDQLMWKWLRCELSHRGALPVDVQLSLPDDDADKLWIRAGGAPEYCVLISCGWYAWLRGIVQESSVAHR